MKIHEAMYKTRKKNQWPTEHNNSQKNFNGVSLHHTQEHFGLIHVQYRNASRLPISKCYSISMLALHCKVS